MTTLPIVTRENAPMQLSEFMNLPPEGFNENASLFCYEVKKHGEDGIRVANQKKGKRFALLKEAVMKAKPSEKPNAVWGSFFEFGFGSGRTLNFIAAIANNAFVYGFDSGIGTGENEMLQERPFAYTKTLVPKNPNNDTYGNEDKLELVPRTLEDQEPFLPFTPLSNVSLYLGDIEKTLPAYLVQATEKPVSFIFIDLNDSVLTQKVLNLLASRATLNTIIVTDHALDTDTVYRQAAFPTDNKKIKVFTQDTVDLRLDYFVQTPKKTVAKTDDPNSSGRNVLHFNSKNRIDEFLGNESMSDLREKLKKEKAKVFMSDSEVLHYGIDVARNNFAKERGKTRFYLEFGVCSGRTINFIATLLEGEEKLFGFESGTGLPLDWRTGFPKGMFRYTKKIEKNGETGAVLLEQIPTQKDGEPTLDENVFIPFIPHERVNLSMGLIKETRDTLDDFINDFLKPLGKSGCVAFIHIDTDLEDAALTIMDKLSDYILKEKTVVLFDEAFNFDGRVGETSEKRQDEWKSHEFRALNAFRGPAIWRPVAYNQNGQQMAVVFKV